MTGVLMTYVQLTPAVEFREEDGDSDDAKANDDADDDELS